MSSNTIFFKDLLQSNMKSNLHYSALYVNFENLRNLDHVQGQEKSFYSCDIFPMTKNIQTLKKKKNKNQKHQIPIVSANSQLILIYGTTSTQNTLFRLPGMTPMEASGIQIRKINLSNMLRNYQLYDTCTWSIFIWKIVSHIRRKSSSLNPNRIQDLIM